MESKSLKINTISIKVGLVSELVAHEEGSNVKHNVRRKVIFAEK
jgi:hypothetical protein